MASSAFQKLLVIFGGHADDLAVAYSGADYDVHSGGKALFVAEGVFIQRVYGRIVRERQMTLREQCVELFRCLRSTFRGALQCE